MTPHLYANIALQGFMAFAAVHYLYLWWFSRREAALILFAIFCLLNAATASVMVVLLQASTPAEAQWALDMRTTIGVFVAPIVAWTVAEVAGFRARAFVRAALVFFSAVALVNVAGVPLNGTVTAVDRVPFPLVGEVLSLERGPAGWWGVPVYAAILAVYGFTVVAGYRLFRRDRAGGVMVVAASVVSLSTTLVGAVADVARVPVPYVTNLAHAFWTLVIALLLSREYGRRGEGLVTSEARYRTLIESAPEAIVVLDVTTARFADFNRKALDLFGYPPDELASKSPVDVSPPYQPDGRPSGDAAVGFIREAVEGGEPVFEWTHRAKDGRDIACEIRLVRLPEPSRTLVRGSITDVTERKRTQAALRSMESMHGAILASSLDGLIVIDSTSRIVEFNAAAESIFGHRRGDVIGRDLADLLIPPSLREAHRLGMRRYVETGKGHVTGQRIEMPALRGDGTEVRVELSIQPIAGSEPLLFSGAVRDITGRLRLEEQLRQAQKMEAIGQLAGGVAHDFNNLLTVVSGYCGILQEKLEPGDPRREDVRAISDAGQRAASLTQRLLAFSRQAVLTPKVVDINDIVRDTEHILRRVIGEDILFEVRLDAAAGRVRVDAGHVGQVLINLALNSRDALPSGGRLTILTGRTLLDHDAAGTRELPAGDYVRLEVRDTGSGMAPDVCSRIFEPFFTTKGVGKGTGLGLAVAHGIVTQSGGHIGVDSALGKGTTFTILFPLVADVPRTSPPETHEREVQGSETILLVEDEDAVRTLMTRALRRYGFNVLTASDGAEAIRLARAHEGEIHLLATDVVMPGMSGRDLAEALRRERPGLRVLFMSGYTDDTLLRHGVYEAQEAFLQKPFPLQTLATKVREVLSG